MQPEISHSISTSDPEILVFDRLTDVTIQRKMYLVSRKILHHYSCVCSKKLLKDFFVALFFGGSFVVVVCF